MYELKPDGQILSVKEVGRHKVGTHHTWATHIHASFGGLLKIELRHPVIEDTEWQGQIVEEEKVVNLYYGEEYVEIPVSGTTEEEIIFPAPGRYNLRLEAAGCQGVELGVDIDE